MVELTPAVLSGAAFGFIAFCVRGSLLLVAGNPHPLSLFDRVMIWLLLGGAGVVVTKLVTAGLRQPPFQLEDTAYELPEPQDRHDLIDVWKQVVQVQMHFNEMVMRVRNFGLTLVLGIVAAAGLAIKDKASIVLGSQRVGLETILLLAGLVGWLAFYALDRWYYHMLLVGAVTKGVEIERRARTKIPYLGLAGTITEFSRLRIRGTDPGATVKARHKLDLFYLLVGAVLAIWLLFATSASVRQSSTPAGTAPGLMVSK